MDLREEQYYWQIDPSKTKRDGEAVTWAIDGGPKAGSIECSSIATACKIVEDVNERKRTFRLLAEMYWLTKVVFDRLGKRRDRLCARVSAKEKPDPDEVANLDKTSEEFNRISFILGEVHYVLARNAIKPDVEWDLKPEEIKQFLDISPVHRLVEVSKELRTLVMDEYVDLTDSFAGAGYMASGKCPGVSEEERERYANEEERYGIRLKKIGDTLKKLDKVYEELGAEDKNGIYKGSEERKE